MSRKPRIFIKDYWYHICSRGQRKQPLFFSPEDRIKYLQLLDEEVLRLGARLGAYCLMTNHLHLLIQQGEEPLSKLYQKVHVNYAKYFNRKRSTTGHVFQGPPICRIILNEKYLNSVIRYIHQNPVKAGISSVESEYKWSSSSYYSGKKAEFLPLKSLIIPAGYLSEKNICLEYEKSIQENQGFFGTNDEWLNIQKRSPGRGGVVTLDRRNRMSMQKIAENTCFGTGFSVEEIKSRSRSRNVSKIRHRAMALMIKEGYGFTETAKFFNRTYRIAVKSWEEFNAKNKS